MSVHLRVTPDQDGIKDTDQAALLYNSWLLDVPKLMDIAVLFGHENSKLVQDFMHKVRRGCCLIQHSDAL